MELRYKLVFSKLLDIRLAGKNSHVISILNTAFSLYFIIKLKGGIMPFIGRVARPAPTLDHQTNTFDATEELILLGQDHAFIKKDGRFIGIICVDNLLEEYKSDDISETSVEEFLEPLFFLNEYVHRSKAMEMMLINDIEHIAVTNKADDFVGIASLKQMKDEP